MTRANLFDLASGQIPAICLYDFIDEPTVAAIRSAYSGLVHGYYKDVVPRIEKCGPTVFEHPFTDREHYFKEARETDRLFSAAMQDTVSPLHIFQQKMQEECGWSSTRASDSTFGNYFAGTLRSIEGGTPVHIDYAPYEAPSWEMISSVDAQLSANVYLDGTPGQGNLIIYDKPWILEDEQYRFKDRFGYDDAVVREAPCAVIPPVSGAVVLFNSRCFHRVEPTVTRRLTFSFFFAIQDNSLILWS
ncbi:MAG TPA: hypothetical protein VKU00_14135 [Chthonomonadaceae bacterium]|nr:hypothetical protein [Chthonomonadaceae bacterium]